MEIDGVCSAMITLAGFVRSDIQIDDDFTGDLAVAFHINQPSGPQAVVSVAGDLDANISCSHMVGGITVLGSVLAGSSITVTGNCYGQINTGTLAGQINVHGFLQHNLTTDPTAAINVSSVASTGSIVVGDGAGDFVDGIIHVDGHVQSGGSITVRSVEPTGLIKIGGSLLGSLTCVNTASLEGQVIVNADFSGNVWTGPVAVGSITLDDGLAQPNQAPYYHRPSDDLGGGAVGYAPFRFYPQDCDPPNHGYRLLEDFTDANPIYLPFYGPVAPANSSFPVAVIEYHVPYHCYDNDPANKNWTVANQCFDIDVVGRRLKITPKDAMPKMPGEYRVRTNPTPAIPQVPNLPNLVCAEVALSPAPQSVEYYFWLALDCDGDEDADEDDFIAIEYPDPSECEGVIPHDPDIDCDHNGILDCCDIRVGHVPGNEDTCEFSGKNCFPGCACDFNTDGVLNTQDFFDFVSCFFEECEDADYNGDQVINSQDFFDFLSCFFAGC